MNDTDVARRMWALFEPLHGVAYFSPYTKPGFERAGLRGFWRAYFATRCSPLGAVGPGPVVAAFYGFAPRTVDRALPALWELTTPENALKIRLEVSIEALRAVYEGSDEDLAELAGLMRDAVEGADTAGRVLGGANAALPWPEDPIGVVWQAATVLREHRGDGHLAALMTAEVGGCESIVLKAALVQGGRPMYQAARGWTDEEWDTTVAGLAKRGLLTEDGGATDEGRELDAALDGITDRLATGPWSAIGGAATARCAELLLPFTVAVRERYIPPVTPVGNLPAPR